jgi:ribosomal protein S21
MEFRRRLVYTAASARPVASLFPARTLRPFSTSAARPAGNNNEKNSPAMLGNLFETLLATPRTSASSNLFRPDFGSSPSSMPVSHINAPQKPPKMGPTAGRSVVVQTDVAQAFMKLKSILSQNRVKQDFHLQRFHERPGLKRKRLRSERHRKRFKEGFRRMIAVVMDMKKKGM